MDVRVIKTKADVARFIEGLNRAFKNRSNEKIPFSMMTEEKLENEHITMILVAFDKNTIIGGLCIKESMIDGLRVFKISHLWTAPEHQGLGVASLLIENCEQLAKERNVNYFQMNVASNYSPAVKLYLKHGYKKMKIYANVPHIYYFIRMAKEVPPFTFNEFKRCFTYLKSVLIFYLLFNKESTPTILNRIIYGRKK